jgi:hypothetical protein
MMTEFVSALLFDTGCDIILKSSSIINGLFHRPRGVPLEVVNGDVGLTPDIVEIGVG